MQVCVKAGPPFLVATWPGWQENIDSQRPSYSRAQLRRAAVGYRVGSKTRKYRGQSMALVQPFWSLFGPHSPLGGVQGILAYMHTREIIETTIFVSANFIRL